MWKAHALLVPAESLATGTVIVHAEPPQAVGAVLKFALRRPIERDLDRQLARLRAYAVTQGFAVSAEVRSGRHRRRQGLKCRLRRAGIGVLIVEHRERLTRSAFKKYTEAALGSQQRPHVNADGREMENNVVRDFHEVIGSMYARRYARHSARRRAQKAIEALHG